MLGCAAHDQQAAMGQFQRVGDAGLALAPQVEAAAAAETERGDQRIAAQLWLVVAVPAHGVLAVAVVVQQHAVDPLADLALHALADLAEQRGPWQRPVDLAGITVGGVRSPYQATRRGVGCSSPWMRRIGCSQGVSCSRRNSQALASGASSQCGR